MEDIKEIAAISRSELVRMLRSARVLVLFGLYSMFSVLVLLVVGSVAKAVRTSVNEKVGQLGSDAGVQQAYAQARTGILGFLFSDEPAILEALKEIPLVVLIVFKVTLVFLPAYVALMGFDQISGELGTRSIRYLTVRARRSSVLFGKFLGQAVLLLGLVLVIDLGIFAYAKATNEDFTPAMLASALPRFWAAAMVFSLAYVALTSLCSTLFRSSALSLVVNLVGLFSFWLMDVVGRAESGLGAIRYASPSHYATMLLDPRVAQFAIGVGAYAGFAAVFLGAAYAVIRTRDL